MTDNLADNRKPELMEEASGAAEDATAERICCPNDQSGSWLAPSPLDLASIITSPTH